MVQTARILSCRLRFAPAIALLATLSIVAPAGAAPALELRVGSLELRRCDDGTRWWCGTLPRSLDPARPGGPRIGIDFRWLPARRDAAAARHPALVAVEGGPGYPSTGSRAEFTGIYGPLLRERNLLTWTRRARLASARVGDTSLTLPAP